MDEMAVFKSFLRSMLRQLIELQKAIKNKDLNLAENLINQLIDDIQKGIED